MDQITNLALSAQLQELLKKAGGIGFLGQFLPNLVTLAFIIAVIVAFFILIIGGIRYITSGGDKTQIEAARGQILNAIIGLVIVLAVYAILRLIGGFLGIDLLKLNIEKLILK